MTNPPAENSADTMSEPTPLTPEEELKVEKDVAHYSFRDHVLMLVRASPTRALHWAAFPELPGISGPTIRKCTSVATDHEIGELFNAMWKLNSIGYGIFVGVSAPQNTDGQSVSNNDMDYPRAIVIDVDSENKEESLRHKEVLQSLFSISKMPPDYVVYTSAFRFHLYWMLSPQQIADLSDNDRFSEWTSAQRMLAELMGSDRSVNDPSRVLRATGFRNHKHQPHPRTGWIVRGLKWMEGKFQF